MALPAKVFWAKLQKEIKGKSNTEQIVILRRYAADWPGWDDIQYRKMREQCLKLLRKLENSESVKSSRGHQDLYHVKRQGESGTRCRCVREKVRGVLFEALKPPPPAPPAAPRGW